MSSCSEYLWWLPVFILPVLIYYVKHLFSFWSRQGIPSLPPTIFGPVLRQKECFGVLIRDIHLKSKEPFLGLYYLYRPALLVRDPALVKRIFTTDFDHFVDRGVYCDPVHDPIGNNLFCMTGKPWKDLRVKLTPTFTSGKLKNMFPTIVEKNEVLRDHLLHIAEMDQEVALKTVLIHSNMNIIAPIFFGFDLDTFKDPEHQFAKIGDSYSDPDLLRNNVQTFLTFFCPALMKLLKMPLLSPDTSKYLLNLVHSVMEARTKDPSLIRNDFIQTVMNLMEQEKMSGEDQTTGKLSVECCAAQAFVFYLAGFETSAATTSFCLYELCKNPEWMERVRAEVDALMRRRNGRLEYEDVAEMKLVDMCIKEAMRKYTVVPILNRECRKDYKIPDTDVVIPKGMPIMVSTYGLHMDPVSYVNPEEFDPWRFKNDRSEEDRPFYPVSYIILFIY